MMLEQAIFNFLSQQAPILALLKAPGATDVRIWTLINRQNGRLPSVTLQRITTSRFGTLCGTDGTTRANVQVNAWGKTPEEAWAVSEAIRNAMTDFAGMMGAVKVRLATLEDEADEVDPEPGVFRRRQAWSFWFHS